jgi:AGZA family xanthine/uracil permease-like MFS transporter
VVFYLLLKTKIKKEKEDMEFLKKYFQIEARGSSISAEVIGGVVTFLAMVYILPVNSFMLADAGMSQPGVFVATAIAAGFATILMGFLGKVPIALASGMGINAFFTYTVVLGLGFTWQEALAAVLVSGVLFLIVSLTGLRKLIINAIPRDLKLAIGAGIGFFIAFIGLKNAGIIVSDPATFVALGNLANPVVLLGLVGIFLVLILFTAGGKLSRFAIIISMLAVGIGVVIAKGKQVNIPALRLNSVTIEYDRTLVDRFLWTVVQTKCISPWSCVEQRIGQNHV